MIMIKAKVVCTQYVASEETRIQGNQKAAGKYFKLGFRKTLERNGFWILTKPSHFFVTLDNGHGERTFDMREDILALYNMKRLTENACIKFRRDIANGTIGFNMDEECTCYGITR